MKHERVIGLLRAHLSHYQMVATATDRSGAVVPPAAIFQTTDTEARRRAADIYAADLEDAIMALATVA